MHVTTMSLREFDDAQRLMPPGLAERTQRMRACATRAAWCGCCGVTRRLLRLCFAAVRHGDGEIAELLVTETFDSTARAEGLVEAFMRAWHRTGGIAA